MNEHKQIVELVRERVPDATHIEVDCSDQDNYGTLVWGGRVLTVKEHNTLHVDIPFYAGTGPYGPDQLLNDQISDLLAGFDNLNLDWWEPAGVWLDGLNHRDYAPRRLDLDALDALPLWTVEVRLAGDEVAALKRDLDAWGADREDLSRREDGEFLPGEEKVPPGDEWHYSDDAGIELLARCQALLKPAFDQVQP